MRVKIKQEDLLEYIRQNLSPQQMADKEGVSKVTIWKHIKKIDEDLVEQAKQEAKELEKIERQKRILGYIRQNLTREQMVKKEGVTEVTIWSYIKEIDEDLVKQAQKDGKELEKMERQRRLLEYVRQNLKREQMADKEGVSTVTIWSYIKEINKDLINKAKIETEEEWEQTKHENEEQFLQKRHNNEEIWQKLINESEEKWRKLNKENEKRIKPLKQEERLPKEEIMPNKKASSNNKNKSKLSKFIEEKIQSKTITTNDIKKYKEKLDEKYDKMTYSELDLLIRAYTEVNQLDEAIGFLNKTIYNEDMAYLGTERLNKMKIQVEKIKKKQQACELIKNKEKTAQIAQIVRIE